MPTLTDKQERLCRAVASGKFKTQTAAYASVYDCSRMAGHTIETKASAELKKPHVAERLAQLRDKIAEREAINIDTMSARLLKIADAWEHDETASGRGSSVRAIEVLSKLHGLLEDRTRIMGERGGTLTFVGLGEIERDDDDDEYEEERTDARE